MIIKTLFLASFLIASALATEGEEKKPYPAALLVESNFDFSLTRQEFRVHYGGPRDESSIPPEVSIKLYNPDGGEQFTYNLEKVEERNKRNAFHFALGTVQDGKYEVAVCEGSVCSAKTPSLTNMITTSNEHKLLCRLKDSNQQDVEVNFVEPTDEDWVGNEEYTKFSQTINDARKAAAAAGGAGGAGAAATDEYKTDYEKHNMNENPYYNKGTRIFHAAIKHNLENYKKFFDRKTVNVYCGRQFMLSLHSHIVDIQTKKVLLRLKTVNHLSEAGIELFIRSGKGGKILLESTHENVDIPTGENYEVWASLCVTDKDAIESTYCANPIKRKLKVQE